MNASGPFPSFTNAWVALPRALNPTDASYLSTASDRLDQGLPMPLSEWTRMGIAGAIAIVAMTFLALDAGVVDINSTAIAKRIEIAQASIVDAAMNQHQLATAVQVWAHHNHQMPPSEIE